MPIQYSVITFSDKCEQEVVKIQIPPPKFDRSELHRRPEYANSPSAAGPSNAGPSNMKPPPAVPIRTSPAQPIPSPQQQAQQPPRQIEPHPQQEIIVRPTVPAPQPQNQQVRVAPAKPAPATTGTTTRSDILEALAGPSPASAPLPLPRANAHLQPQSVAPAQLARQQRHSHQPHALQEAVPKPHSQSEPSQEEFAEFAEGDDSFYIDLNLESFDASTTLVDALVLGPSPPPANDASASARLPAAPATDAKGKGRIMSSLMEDSPLPNRSFGIGPPPAYASPIPAPRTSSFTTSPSGGAGAAIVKGTTGGGGFVFPAGVTKPNRSVPPPHPGHMAGVKRSAGEAFAPGKTVTNGPTGAGVGGVAARDRTVLGALEVGPDGAVFKRVRR
jgi:hypothetical protein